MVTIAKTKEYNTFNILTINNKQLKVLIIKRFYENY